MRKRLIRLEKEVAQLRCEANNHKEIEQFYVDMIHNVVKDTVETAVEHAFQRPIELTHEEIEKAFGHRVKIVASRVGDRDV